MPRCKFAAWLARPSARIVVIGASGWVGMALVDQILAAGSDLGADRLRLFGSRRRPLKIAGRDLEIEPLEDAPPLGEGDWLVLHAGILGADRVDGGDLDIVRSRNDQLLRKVLALAETGATTRLVFFSSGAAARSESGGPAKQAYGRMKLEHEVEIAAWARRTGRPVLIPRVFSLGGPYINHTQAYALGDFILQGARQGRIAIGASGLVIRSFVHVLDMARVVLDMAVDETQTSVPFDVCLGRDVELQALAEAVVRALDIELIVDRPPLSGEISDRYVGDGRRFQAALARQGQAPASLDAIVADTLAYLRETQEIPPPA